LISNDSNEQGMENRYNKVGEFCQKKSFLDEDFQTSSKNVPHRNAYLFYRDYSGYGHMVENKNSGELFSVLNALCLTKNFALMKKLIVSVLCKS
jgi:hypothetical protein